MVSLYFYIQTRAVHFNTGFMSYCNFISTELWLLTTRYEVIKQYFLYRSKKCMFILETDSKTTNTEAVHFSKNLQKFLKRESCLSVHTMQWEVWDQRVCIACLTDQRNPWEMEGVRQSHGSIQYQSGRESQFPEFGPNFLSKSVVWTKWPRTPFRQIQCSRFQLFTEIISMADHSYCEKFSSCVWLESPLE